MKDAFHPIAICIAMSSIRSVFGAGAARREHRLRAYGLDIRDQRLDILSLVADDAWVCRPSSGLGLRHVRHVAARQEPAQRVAPRIDREMDLGPPPAPRAVRAVFFGAPAACWWARTTVRSMSSASQSASWQIAARIHCHTPVFPPPARSASTSHARSLTLALCRATDGLSAPSTTPPRYTGCGPMLSPRNRWRGQDVNP